MSFWTKIGSLFKGGVSIDKVFTSASKGIDNLALTDQEKADSLRDFVKETLSENTERSKSRRFIVKVVIYANIALLAITIACYFVDNIEGVKAMLEIAKAFKMDIAFLMVLTFFFGGYYAGKVSIKETPKNPKV